MTSIPIRAPARLFAPRVGPGARPRGLALAALGILALSACDEDSIIRQGIDTLGNGFVEAFGQDANDQPVDADGVGLTLTPEVEPFDP